MTQKLFVSKKNDRAVKQDIPVVNRLTGNLMNVGALLALFMVVIPMIPLATRVSENSDVVMYNMLGILNQDIGANATRATAATMLMYFAVAVILMVVGYFTAMFKQRSSAVFYALGGTSMSVFSITWLSEMFGMSENPFAGDAAASLTQIDAAKISFENSPFPVLMVILSFVLIFVSLALVCVYKQEK